MADPPIKSSLQSKAFTDEITILLGALGTDRAVRARLSACLASDGSHITPNSNGEHVAAIQRALMAIKKSPKFPIMSRLPSITDPPGFYGPMTVSAVLFYKAIYHIQRTGQPLDNITGRGTITQLDNDMIEIESGSQPKPVPPSPGNWNFTVPNLPIIIKEQDGDPAKGICKTRKRVRTRRESPASRSWDSRTASSSFPPPRFVRGRSSVKLARAVPKRPRWPTRSFSGTPPPRPG